MTTYLILVVFIAVTIRYSTHQDWPGGSVKARAVSWAVITFISAVAGLFLYVPLYLAATGHIESAAICLGFEILAFVVLVLDVAQRHRDERDEEWLKDYHKSSQELDSFIDKEDDFPELPDYIDPKDLN